MTFQIRKTENEQFYFRAISSEFVLVAISEPYQTYESCLTAIRTICGEAAEASIYNQTEWHL